MVDSWNALCMLSGTEGDGKPRHPKPRVNKVITFQCFSKKNTRDAKRLRARRLCKATAKTEGESVNLRASSRSNDIKR